MIVYLAGESYEEIFQKVDYKFNKLDSFYYAKKHSIREQTIPKYNKYILDSGAFTFMMAKTKKKVDIDIFTDEYIEYINNNKIDLFFEMDVDSIFGYDKVKQLRRKIESKTGKQSIPVFHMKRGLDDWNGMIKDYDYVSLGIAGKDVAWGDTETFYKFVMNARSQNCKVHGLGITGMKTLKKVPFYSVDSSSWLAGNRYKTLVWFNGKEVKTIDTKNKGRIKNQLQLGHHNFGEWVKFSKSMENKIVI